MDLRGPGGGAAPGAWKRGDYGPHGTGASEGGNDI